MDPNQDPFFEDGLGYEWFEKQGPKSRYCRFYKFGSKTGPNGSVHNFFTNHNLTALIQKDTKFNKEYLYIKIRNTTNIQF